MKTQNFAAESGVNDRNLSILKVRGITELKKHIMKEIR
jgi:hypothetical protein